jgi:hypothetical protein
MLEMNFSSNPDSALKTKIGFWAYLRTFDLAPKFVISKPKLEYFCGTISPPPLSYKFIIRDNCYEGINNRLRFG